MKRTNNSNGGKENNDNDQTIDPIGHLDDRANPRQNAIEINVDADARGGVITDAVIDAVIDVIDARVGGLGHIRRGRQSRSQRPNYFRRR